MPLAAHIQLIIELRAQGVSYPEIGRRIAEIEGRRVVYRAQSARDVYARWQDERGIRPSPEKRDMRHRENRS